MDMNKLQVGKAYTPSGLEYLCLNPAPEWSLGVFLTKSFPKASLSG